jgi:hypothetical protein
MSPCGEACARFASRARAGLIGARTAVALLLEVRDFSFIDSIDVGVRRVGNETQAVVFRLDQFLTDFRTGLFLSRRAARNACNGENNDRERNHGMFISNS